MDYQGIHEYENYIDENEGECRLEHQNLERIKINGNWMLKDRDTNELYPTSQFEDHQTETSHLGDTTIEPEITEPPEVTESRNRLRQIDPGPSTSQGVITPQHLDNSKDSCNFRKIYKKSCDFENCEKPQNDIQNWIRCSGCLKWFHYECVGLRSHPDKKEDYLCTNCRNILSIGRRQLIR